METFELITIINRFDNFDLFIITIFLVLVLLLILFFWLPLLLDALTPPTSAFFSLFFRSWRECVLKIHLWLFFSDLNSILVAPQWSQGFHKTQGQAELLDIYVFVAVLFEL